MNDSTEDNEMPDDNTIQLLRVINSTIECVKANWTDSIGVACAQCFEQMKEDVQRIGWQNENVVERCNQISAICSGIMDEEDEPPIRKLVLRRR